jgi:hypothetical protein
MGRLLTVTLSVLAAVSLAVAGSASAAKTVEPWVHTECGFVYYVTADESSGSRTRDNVAVLYDLGLFGQGGIVFHRAYDADTMRGTVSGTLFGGGVGTWVYTGELHGVITQDGMRGHFSLTKTPDESSTNEGSWKIVGTWESEGHPVAEGPWSMYCVSFEGMIIGSFD